MSKSAKRKIVRALIGGGILYALSLVWMLAVSRSPLEVMSLDVRYRRANRETRASNKVLVIDIDDQSLKSLSAVMERGRGRAESTRT